MIRQRFSFQAYHLSIFGILILVSLLLAAPTFAQEPGGGITDDEVNAIAKDLYCPICESTPLDVCPTQACKDWREVIRTKLSEGQGEEEIKAYFELQYGARALAEPPQSGFSLTAWIMPFVLVAAVLLVFIYYMRSIRAPRSAQAASAAHQEVQLEETQVQAELDEDDYAARIERELREM